MGKARVNKHVIRPNKEKFCGGHYQKGRDVALGLNIAGLNDHPSHSNHGVFTGSDLDNSF